MKNKFVAIIGGLVLLCCLPDRAEAQFHWNYSGYNNCGEYFSINIFTTYPLTTNEKVAYVWTAENSCDLYEGELDHDVSPVINGVNWDDFPCGEEIFFGCGTTGFGYYYRPCEGDDGNIDI
jgi:hypothetical protein